MALQVAWLLLDRAEPASLGCPQLKVVRVAQSAAQADAMQPRAWTLPEQEAEQSWEWMELAPMEQSVPVALPLPVSAGLASLSTRRSLSLFPPQRLLPHPQASGSAFAPGPRDRYPANWSASSCPSLQFRAGNRSKLWL